MIVCVCVCVAINIKVYKGSPGTFQRVFVEPGGGLKAAVRSQLLFSCSFILREFPQL